MKPTMKTIEVVLYIPNPKVDKSPTAFAANRRSSRATKAQVSDDKTADIKALIAATTIDGTEHMTEAIAGQIIEDLYGRDGEAKLHMSAERYGCFMVNRHSIAFKYSWQVKSSKFVDQPQKVFNLER